MPPPLDNTLYFGSMILIKHQTKNINNNNVKDISLEEWNKIYEKLFGGFEDLNDNDSYSEEEEIPEHFKTKEGYSKEDGFIVDDDDSDDEDYIPSEEKEESEEESESFDYTGEEETGEEDSDEESDNESEYDESDDDIEEILESDIEGDNSELEEEEYDD